MKRFRTLIVASALAFMVALGCEDGNPLGGGGGGGSDFGVTVSTGTTPSYTWSVGDAFSLSVVRTADPATPVWGISSPGQELISSPVTHGTVPAPGVGSIFETAVAEQTLAAGVEYRVSITRLNGQTGFVEFIP